MTHTTLKLTLAILVIVLCNVRAAYPQITPSPKQDTRTSNSAATSDKPTLPTSSDINAALQQLQAPSDTAPAQVHRDPPAMKEVPKDFIEKRDVDIPTTGVRALRASHEWENTVNTPTQGPDGRVLYTYGGGMPIVICSPLRVCIVELEPGEHFSSAPHIGDAVRWDVSLETSGAGEQATPTIILKPRESGLDTTLFMATDRRSYYLRLLSKDDSYTPIIAFDYPEEQAARLQNAILLQQQQQKLMDTTRISHITTPIESIFFDFKISGGDNSIRPIRVMDDGNKTYIQMPESALHRELPTLVVEGPGGDELVNFRVKDNYYIVDRLFDKAALLLGAGKHTRKVEITRQGGTYHVKQNTASAAAAESQPGSN